MNTVLSFPGLAMLETACSEPNRLMTDINVKTISAFIIVLSLSTSISLIITPLSAFLSRRFNVVDKPGGRRKGHGVIPRLGGIAIFTGFLTAALVAQALPIPRLDPNEFTRFTGLIIGGAFIFILGLVDDFVELGPIPQLIGQIAVSLFAIHSLIFIETINNPFTGNQIQWSFGITLLISLFWLVLMMNTVNFLDGLDGLASGVSLIAGLILFINSAFRLSPPQISVSLLPLALIGGSLGFLIYNFHPAKIFMGSSGSYFLGYALGTLSIIGGAKMATILLVMGLPLLDVAWQIVNRITQRRHPMQGDRGHIHFRLLDMNLGHRRIVLIYYGFCAFFGTLTLITNSRLFKLAALVTMTLIVMAGFYALKQIEEVTDHTKKVNN